MYFFKNDKECSWKNLLCFGKQNANYFSLQCSLVKIHLSLLIMNRQLILINKLMQLLQITKIGLVTLINFIFLFQIIKKIT